MTWVKNSGECELLRSRDGGPLETGERLGASPTSLLNEADRASFGRDSALLRALALTEKGRPCQESGGQLISGSR
jgi:hypothetical protein